MAVAAADVGPGDEVIVPSFTFEATALAVLHHNGIPIFTDIDLDTANMDPQSLAERITPRTRAVIPVHLFGLPAKMDEIRALATKHGLLVIEDAAQAHGARYRGRKVGSLGDMGAFSLNATKNMHSAEGGIFVTNNDEFRDKAALMRMFGERIFVDRSREYQAYAMGWNYRSTEINAALAHSQLPRLEAGNELRRANATYLSLRLSQIPGIVVPRLPEDCVSAMYMYHVRLQPEELALADIPVDHFRNALVAALRAEGVEARPLWESLVPLQALWQLQKGYGQGCPWSCPYYKAQPIAYHVEDYPRALQFARSHLCVYGTWPPNDESLMRLFVDAFEKLFEHLDEIVEIARSQKWDPVDWSRMGPGMAPHSPTR
jgi:dTDP-4-amino-4,6-dideoxygalactose transaminase